MGGVITCDTCYGVTSLLSLTNSVTRKRAQVLRVTRKWVIELLIRKFMTFLPSRQGRLLTPTKFQGLTDHVSKELPSYSQKDFRFHGNRTLRKLNAISTFLQFLASQF